MAVPSRESPLETRIRRDGGMLADNERLRTTAVAVLLVLLLAGSALLLLNQPALDPLAPYRAPDGSLRIPGGALTPELQHLIFGGNDLQPYLNLSHYAPGRSSYPTANLVLRPYLTPNPNVFTHPKQPSETLASGVAHLLSRWFPPVDWGAQVRAAAGWFFGLFTWDARASVAVDSTTVSIDTTAATTCTTSQTAAPSDNGVIVILSEAGSTAYLSVTYGATSLTLIPNAAQSNGIAARIEIWGFSGIIPSGVQTMTATLTGGAKAKQTCATVLLSGVSPTGAFINGTSVIGATANPGITLGAAVTLGNMGIAGLALAAGNGPTAVTGTGATATSLFGIPSVCSSGNSICGAGADIPNPGTAITWTAPAASWAVAAVEVVQAACGTGGANCYRIGAGGAWNSPTNWSNFSGGASCGCTPSTTDIAVFNATPTGTTSLVAATTVAGIDMTGFTGTLDTNNPNNWALTVNGNFAIQGTFLARGSTITVSGNISVLGSTTVVTMSSSTWTVGGTWTNNSTSASWSAGTSTVTIRDAASGTLTFASLSGSTNEFNNLTLDSTAAAGVTYTMATNGLRLGATLLIQNSAVGATGATILDTSAANLAVTTGALTLATWGGFNSEGSAIAVNGNLAVSAATGYVTSTAGSWTITGTWSDASTSASWSVAAAVTFRAPANRVMTFGGQSGNEFAGSVTFDTTAVAGVTYTMGGTNPLDVGGLLTVQNSAGGATGAVVLDSSAANLGINVGGLTQSTLGGLNTRASSITVNGDVNVSAANAYITNAGGAFSVSGAWTNRTTSASWSFAAAITFRAAAARTMTFTGSNLAGNEFAGAVTFDTTVAAGVTYTMASGGTGDASLKIGGALTVQNTAAGATAATILDTSASNYNVTASSLTLGTPRGALRSEGSTITINGAVSIADASSYLVLGSATWTVAGAWTNNSTDSADWSAGTGTVSFRNSANATMTFANLGANEFNNVTFDTSNAVGITYTMATNGLLTAGTLRIQNTAATPTGNVVLTTGAGGLPLAAGSIILGTRGTLTANGSTITVNGSWTSTAANHVWNRGTSTVVFAATGTITMAAGESFANLTQSTGTTTLGSSVTVAGTTTVNGILDTSASSFALTLQASLSIGSAGVLNLEASTASTAGNVTIAAGGAVRFTGSGIWTINGSWTDSNTSVPATWAASLSTVRFVGGGATTLTFWTAAGSEFNNLVLDSSVVAGITYAQVNPLQAASTLTIQNTAAGATGAVLLDASAVNYGTTVGGLVLGTLGGFAARGAAVTVNGNVSVAASGYATSAGTGTWAVTGSWTDGSTSASWSFSAPITFRSAVAQTMTFKATGTEFGGAVTFDTTAAAGVTYTMATNGLALSGLLAVRNSVVGPTGNTILDTSATSRAISAGSVTIGTNGTIRANGSTITVGGDWTVTAANASFVAGTSTVVFTAAAAINMVQAFNNLSVTAGTSTLAANTTVNASATVSGGILAKATFAFSAATLTLSGGALTSTSGAGNITGNVSISAAASYISFGSETWTVGGSWTNASTSASWSAGTGTVIFNAGSPATMTFAGTNLGGNEFNTVTFDTASAPGVAYTMAARGLRIAGALLVRNSTASPTGNVVLNTSAGGLAVTAGSLTLGANGTLTANGSSITLSGNWTSSAAGAVFNANSSTVILTAAATVALGGAQSFNILTITAGTITQGTQLTANAITISGGSLAKAANTLTVNGALTLSGGSLISTSGNGVVTGNVTISSAASYIAFGSETWTITGTWTNASTSAAWSAGTGTVTFTPGASGTYTFGNLGANEFNNITFSPTAAAVVTMAANALRWGGALALNANVTLATGGLSLAGGSLNVGNGATLTANASAVGVTDVTMTGGASGTLTLTTGAWSVSGNWDTSGIGSTFTSGSSSVTLTGAAKSVKLLAGQQFATLNISGTIGQASDLKAASLTVMGTLTKSGFNLVVNALTSNAGTIADGAVSVTGFTVSDSDPTAYITFSVFSTWTANTQYAWTHTDSKTTDTITFTIGGQTGLVFNVYKNGSLFTNGNIVGGNITFTMLGSDPNVVVNPSACGGNSRYWVGGTGNWSQTSHWASSSGGVGGCSLPGNPTDVFFDANSGSGTVTVDMNDNFATLNTTGSTISTIALGTNSLTTSGNVTHAAGIITIGASAGTGLTVGGSLTLSGTAALDGSGAASVLNVTGSVTVSSATAYLRMGSGTWTVSGAWSNSSGSASWSAGTGTVVFNAATAQTMTFAGANLPGAEFYNVTFNSGAATTTFTLSTRGLNVGNLVTIQGGAGVTTLDLSAGNLPLTTVGITVAAGGVLNGRGGTITVSGNWDTHLGTFTSGTSTVVLTGAARSVSTASAFATLTVSGSYTLASAVTAGTTTVSGSLNTSAGNFALSVADLTITGTLTANASAVGVSGNWDSHLGTFTAGTSTVTLSGAAKTVNTASAFATLIVSGSCTMASAITSGATTVSGTLSTSASNLALTVTDLTVTGSLSANGSTITVSGNWDSHLGTFTAGTSTVTLSGAAKTVNTASAFATLSISGSYTMSSAVTAGATNVSGTLSTSATGYGLTVGNLTVTGTLTGNGSAIGVTGNWDSHLGTFTAGTSTVTMSGLAKTLNTASAFAGLHITGTVTLASAVTAGNTLAIDTNGSLDTSASSFALSATSLTVGATGTLVGEASTITVTSMDTHLGTFTVGTSTVIVNASAGTINIPQTLNNFTVSASVTTTISSNLTWSGALTLSNGDAVSVGGNLASSGASATLTFNGAALTVAGNWDTSSTSGSFNAGTSAVTLSGAAKTFKTAAGQTLYGVTVSGTVALSSDLQAASLAVTGTLTKTGFSIVFNGLAAAAGVIADGAVSASNFAVTNSEATAFTTISIFNVWTTNIQYGWTHTSSSATTTITFTITGVTGSVYNVTKDGTFFTSGSVVGGQIQFTMLGSDPVMIVNLSGCTGTDEYWVLGTGNWSDPAHWATSSGGVGGCPAPLSTINVHVDANSGTGTITVNVDVSIASLNTTGSTVGTLAIGTHNFSVAGSVTLAAGTTSVGASAGTGLAVGGTLTLSGAAVLDGSAGASIVSVTGNATLSTATAYVRMGSGTWTFGGSWTNNSTSSSWSAGTGTVVFRAAASATMTLGNLVGNEFNNLTLDTTAPAGVTYTMAANPLKVGGALLVQNSTASPTGNVGLTTSNLAVNTGPITIGTNGTITAGSSTITVSGSWTATAANATFGAGTSTVSLGTTATVAMTQSFYNLTITAGVLTAGSNLAATNAMTVAGGTLAKSTFGLAVASLTLSGGALTSTSGNVTVTGNVNVSAAASYIAFGSETWTVSGSWTNASTSSSWVPGTGTVLFAASASQTMTFAGTNLAGSEFNNVTFNAGASTATFSLGTRGLRLAAILTVGGGTGVTTLDTSVAGLALTAGTLNVLAGGALTANGSTITVTSIDTHLGTFATGTSTVVVNTSGGSVNIPQTVNNLTVSAAVSTTFTSAITWSGTLTLTGATASFTSDLISSGPATLTFGSATLSIGGNWNTSSATGFTSTGSSVSLTGAAKTLTLAAGQTLATLNVSGTYALGSPLTANGLITVGGTLDTTASSYSITANAAMTVSGAGAILRSNASAVAVTGSLTVDNAAGYIVSSAGGSWTVTNGSWANSSTSASWSFAAPITFRSNASRTMTFGNLTLEFAGNVTFDSNVAAGVTYTMSTHGLVVGGTLSIQNTAPSPTGNTSLNTSASNLAVAATTVTLTATGTLTANGSTITVRSIDTHQGTFNAGTSTVVVNASGGTVNISQAAHSLTVNGGVTTSFTGSLTWAGVLTLTSATVDFGANSLTASGAATMTFASATITMGAGNWDTSSATTFTATGSSVTFSGTGNLALGAGASLATVTVTGGTRTLLAPVAAAGLLTLAGGVLAKGANALTMNAGLALTGGALTSTSGAVTVTGNVVISSATSYIVFGSESWTVSGSWTNASTSASWSAGTATITFTSASSQTMDFASLPGAIAEFNNVTFDSGASTATFTMAGNGLAWSGTLTIRAGTGATTLATGGLGLSGGAVSVGNGGSLTAGSSAVSVTDLAMVGGVSGSIALTTGTWSVSGVWDTSGAGSTFSSGTSTVTLSGASTTVDLAAGQSFYNLVISGVVSLSSAVTALATITIANGAVLTKTGQSLTFNGLTEMGTGRITDGSVTVVNLSVTNSDAANLTTVSVFTVWTVDWEYTWTHTSTVPTSTLTFTIGGNTSGYRYNVTKDGAPFATGFVDASGQVVLTMLGSDPVVDVVIAVPCGANRYWVGGAGNWSDSTHWSASSGGAGGCPVPNAPSTVLFDGNSGGGVVTLDQNASMASLNTAGWTGTIAAGTFNVAVGGNVTLAGGTVTLGAAAGAGLTVAGNLTLAGAAVLDGSGAASLVTVAGDMSISSATAYLRMGNGTWTIGGLWSNASLSANWSAGTGTVVFNSSTSQTMVFAGFAGKEFNNVVFASSSVGPVTFTAGTNSLKWSGTLTIQDASGSTTLATADLPLAGGALVVGNGGALAANASSVAVTDVTMTGGASGSIALTSGSWTVSGNWDTSGAGSVFAKGTSTVTMSGAARTLKTLNASNGFWNLAISGTVTQTSGVDVTGSLAINGTLTTAGNDLSGGASLVLSGGGALYGTSATITLASVTMNDAAANTLSLTSATVLVSGSWDTSGAASLFAAGTSTVSLAAATGTILLGSSQSFATLVISGNFTLATQLSASSLTLSAGTLVKGTNALTLSGDLSLAGGSITSVSGDVVIGGSVDISAASSFISFGSETWTIGGAWTNVSTSTSWSPGTGSVIFDSASLQTMSFAGTNLAAVEFNAVVFNSGPSAVTFTMAGPGLRAHTVTVQGGSGTTTLDTSSSSLPITADSLTVAAGGALWANGSTLTLRTMDTSAGSFTAGASTVLVNASGGVIRVPQGFHNLTVNAGIATTFAANVVWSTALTLTGATVTFQANLTASGAATLSFGLATISVAGSWDTSAAVTFTSGGSSVTFTGSGQRIVLGAGQAFATLVIAGSIAIGSDISATSLTVNGAGVLTKTNHAISFNSLVLSGTISDGSVNVTDLTVTNSDATALVTISVFTTWNTGSEYAWTHTSTETGQTITWTLGGNTSGFLYHVTKNGSSFAQGTVDGSGNVVVTMLGSDPDMRITVAPPPVPAWWQSPYFLAALPLPFLVVIAMFVQRRRWRPTKAFLVDERGQLLREFTLDPSCEVTYDQTLQAGALDAVDKDVRVAKYHARAVHGDMLSLIMLAVGPANVQEVEFARGLLVSIQDKLEDSAKARVEEARNEEAGLETARAQDTEERTDLQTRARVFGDMVNAFTIARTKLEADSLKLRKMDTNLRQREEDLAEVRTSLEEQTAQMEARRADLERTAEELKAEKRELEGVQEALRQREKAIAPREKSVERQAREISDKETNLAEREAELATAQSKLATDLDDYRTKAEQAAALQAELSEERTALDDLSLQLDEQTKALESRTSSLETREKEVAERSEDLRTKLSELGPREQSLETKEAELTSRNAALAQNEGALATREKDVRAQLDDLQSRETALAGKAQELKDEREALDRLTNEAAEERKALEAKAARLVEEEADIAKKTQDLANLTENLGPREAAIFQKETDLSAREKAVAEERQALQSQQDLVAAKALEIEQKLEQIKERETSLNQEKLFIKEARGACEEEGKQLEARKTEFARELEGQRASLAAQEKALGDARLQLTKDTETFEGEQEEKSQWIASKEIELEAKEQGLIDREGEIRAQAEENARRLSELAAREETVEIDGDKLEKARAELESQKAEVGAMARDLEAKTIRFREEESQKGEELRTWQTTLESEQALLKEQREMFEKEMQELRESWAGRMIRVEQREEELQQRESKVQADVEWVARSESDLSTREKAATEKLNAAAELRAQGERLRAELEQRAMEVESRERELHEEAAEQSVTLEKRMESLQAQEAEFTGQKAQWERELAAQVQNVKAREAEVKALRENLDVRETNLKSREETLVNDVATLRQDEEQLAREKSEVLAMEKKLDATQIELAQTRERLDAEAVRLSTEADAVRQSLAAKEADLTSERERLERDSSALQDKLGAKAKEMAAREKAVTAREDELRAEEQDLDARLREIESRERQATAHLAELDARADSLSKSEAEQKSRRTEFDEAVQKFETESAVRQKEWKDLQNTLKSQEARLAASTETRQAEIRKRMEDLEQRERSINASQTQGQIERGRLEAQAKAQTAKQSDLDAAAARADKRFAELKAMEEELLKGRQGFETERAAWSNRRTEELRQLEATRDAAAEQTAQAERLIEESQRRSFLAAEAEKAAKRQAEDLVAAQSLHEKRRSDAERAEKDLEAKMAELRDASKRLGAKELELASRAKDTEALQARLADAEKKNAEAAEALKVRKGSLDQEAERIATLAAQSDRRQAEIEARQVAVETKLSEVTKREQVLSTELQRADNLMEDLNRKELEIQTHEKAFAGREQDLSKREQALEERDSELREGMQTLERLRREHETRAAQAEEDHRAAAEARKEADAVRSDAEKLKAQADAMQAEVAKNMRFLQKKALDVLDREEKIRAREVKVDEQGHLLESRAQILDQKDRVFDTEKDEMTGRLEKAKQENEKLKAKLAEAEKASKSTIDMDEWKRDIENRVKIIQKKALDLLDREEKLRKKEEELRALAAQLGVEAKS